MFFEYIKNNMSEILIAIEQHVSISLISLFIACLLAIPFAIIVRNKPKIAHFILQLANIFQTIPSLALLGLLIPIAGIGTLPSIIALVIYAFMPIFQNTYTGLNNVDNNYINIAKALGLSNKTRLFKIELPLASKTIFAGIKMALVLTIGTATLAALIGAGGLGNFILSGIETNNQNSLLIGAILSALLALIFSWIMDLLINKQWQSILIVITIIISSLTFFGAYQYHVNNNKEIVTIGGKLGAEPDILINMYKELIEHDNKNVKVRLKPNMGSTSFLFKALKKGSIDIYPEFTGTIVKDLLHQKNISNNAKDVYIQAKNEIYKKYNLIYLKPMKYQNTYSLAVSQKFANKYHIDDISELKPISTALKAGFDTDFANQKDGYLELKEKYHLDINSIKTMSSPLKYQALINNSVNIIDVYTTDAQIKKYNLKLLKDNLHAFPPYQGAPLTTKKFAKNNPKIMNTLNKLSNHITDKEMQQMNYEVVVNHRKAKDVAHQYLIKHHLL